MKRIVVGLSVSVSLSACSPWSAADSDRAFIGGESYRVNYLSTSPGIYDMRAYINRWSGEGIPEEDKAFTVAATGQIAKKLCGGDVELVSVDRISGGTVPYAARWRCR